MYGTDCYSKEHTNITDDDFSHCDYIVVVSEDEQKDFMLENYANTQIKCNFGTLKKCREL